MRFEEALRRNRVELLALLGVLALTYAVIVRDMVLDWYRDDNYSHGFLVPLIAGYFLWLRRRELLEAEVRPSDLGLPVLLAAFVQLVVAWLGNEYFNMRLSLLVMLGGVSLYWFGRDVFRVLRTPLAYLLLMIPIPYILYDSVAFPLKLLVTRISVTALKLMGVAVWREGNILMFPEITLEVADACSGLRSLMSLLALGVALALLFRMANWKRLLLILSTVPIAMATNALRVIGTGVLAERYGAVAAEGFFHEFAGLVVFVVATALLFLVGLILKRVGS